MNKSTTQIICHYLVATVFLLFMLMSVVSAAQRLTQPWRELEVVGSVGGACRAVDVSSGLAVISEGRSLSILKLDNPAKPTPLGRFLLPNIIGHIKVAGHFAYVGETSGNGFHIINIASASAPVRVGGLQMPGPVRDIEVMGSMILAACGAAGLQIIDVKDPGAPALIKSITTSSRMLGLAVTGDKLVTAEWQAGLRIFDLADPTSPTLTASLALPSPALAVAVANGKAYVGLAGPKRGLQIVDLAGPANPQLKGWLHTSGDVQVVTASGERIWLATQDYACQAVDVTNPDVPLLKGAVDSDDTPNQLVVVDSLGLAADNSSLKIIDLSATDLPTLRGDYNTPDLVMDFAVSDDKAFIADYFNGLAVIDLHTPQRPESRGVFPTGLAEDLSAAGTTVAMEGSKFLGIFDCSQAGTPNLLTKIEPKDSEPDDIFVKFFKAMLQGEHLITLLESTTTNNTVTSNTVKLKVFDLADPTQPHVLGNYQYPLSKNSQVSYLALTGNLAIFNNHDIYSQPRMEVIDLSNPQMPTHRSTILLDSKYSWWGQIEAADSRVGAMNRDVLKVFDLSDPSSPTLTLEKKPKQGIVSYTLSDHYLFLLTALGNTPGSSYPAPDQMRLEVYDLNSPAQPIGSCVLPNYWQRKIKVKGPFIYIGGGLGGITIVADSYAWQSGVKADTWQLYE